VDDHRVAELLRRLVVVEDLQRVERLPVLRGIDSEAVRGVGIGTVVCPGASVGRGAIVGIVTTASSLSTRFAVMSSWMTRAVAMDPKAKRGRTAATSTVEVTRRLCSRAEGVDRSCQRVHARERVPRRIGYSTNLYDSSETANVTAINATNSRSVSGVPAVLRWIWKIVQW
jgi:hypothetical protein